MRRGAGPTPPLFLNQLVHLILRNALEGCEDPYVLRAGELFFRPQRVSFHDGAACSGRRRGDRGARGRRAASPRSSPCSGEEPAAELDVLDDANAWTYWSRSDAFTMALNLGATARPRGIGPRRSRPGSSTCSTSSVGGRAGRADRGPGLALVRRPRRRGDPRSATRSGRRGRRGRGRDGAHAGAVPPHLRGPQRVDPRAAGHPVYLLLAMTPDASCA